MANKMRTWKYLVVLGAFLAGLASEVRADAFNQCNENGAYFTCNDGTYGQHWVQTNGSSDPQRWTTTLYTWCSASRQCSGGGTHWTTP